MSESIEVSRVIPARPERVFNAWLSGDEHGLMIGAGATYETDTGAFTAWDGYIWGKTLAKEPHRRIVQSWRTSEFSEDDADSRLEVLLDEVPEGTRVTLVHTNIPEGQGESYEVGWSDHYFDPMTDYFQSARSRLKDAGEAISEAAEEAGEAFEAVGVEAKKAAKKVQKQAKAAAKKVKALVQKARKKLQAASKRKAKPAKKAAKKPARKPAKKAAPKKKAKAAKKRR